MPRGHDHADLADAERQIGLILGGGPLCWDCLAGTLGVAPATLEATLGDLRRRIAVAHALAPCDHCNRNALLYRIR